MSKRLYIAYGSNLNLRQMAMRCPTAKLFGTGEVKGYELQFKGSPHSAFATIAPNKDASVPVAVWDIKPRDEHALDVYEGYPSHYYKQNIPVTVNGQEMTAMVYLMNQKADFGIPSQRYYNTVYEGYENCGLDVNVLNRAVDDSIEKYREIEQKQDKFSWFGYDSDDEPDEEFDGQDEYNGEDYDDPDFEDDQTPDEPDPNDPFFFSDQIRFL